MAASKKTAKKTTKKATKRTSADRTTKRTTKQARKVAKKTASKERAARKTTKEIKKSRVTGGSGQIAITDATKKPKGSRSKQQRTSKSLSTSRAQIAVLSPLRFPLKYEQLLAQTARVSGLTFVTLGALVLLVNLHVLDLRMEASLIEAQSASTIQASDVDATSQITITDDDDPQGQLTVEVEVERAEDAEINAYNLRTDEYQLLGNAYYDGGDTWKYVWNTATLEHGPYLIYTTIKNAQGLYKSGYTEYTITDLPSEDLNDAESVNVLDDVEVQDHSTTTIRFDRGTNEPVDYEAFEDQGTGTHSVHPDRDESASSSESIYSTSTNEIQTEQMSTTTDADTPRADPLQINDVVLRYSDSDDEHAHAAGPSMVISGTGSPNSHVIVYVSDSSIAAAVRTTDDGDWRYAVDQEVQAGLYEVSSTLMDDTGRVIATSTPFKFIAEERVRAQTETQGNNAQANVIHSSLFPFLSQNIALSVASGGVVVIGLILLLLGMHVRGRKDDDVAADKTTR